MFSSTFLVVDLVGFSEVHPQGMRPFGECPNPLFLAPHPLFWVPHPLFWGGKSPHFSTFFVFFYIDFVFFFMNFAYFPVFFVKFSACANANWQISGVCQGPHLPPHQGRLDRNEPDFVLWSFFYVIPLCDE